MVVHARARAHMRVHSGRMRYFHHSIGSSHYMYTIIYFEVSSSLNKREREKKNIPQKCNFHQKIKSDSTKQRIGGKNNVDWGKTWDVSCAMTFFLVEGTSDTWRSQNMFAISRKKATGDPPWLHKTCLGFCTWIFKGRRLPFLFSVERGYFQFHSLQHQGPPPFRALALT